MSNIGRKARVLTDDDALDDNGRVSAPLPCSASAPFGRAGSLWVVFKEPPV